MANQYLLSLLIIMLSVSNAQAQSTIENYLRLEQDQFILYAPNQMELESGKNKLTYAAQKFSNYFGNHSVKISVLLTENPSEIQNLDLNDLRKDSDHFLPFFTESSLNNQTHNAANVFALNMGAIVMEKNSNIEVAAVIESANDLKVDLRASDIITAFNGDKISTLEEFKKHYNVINVSDKITLKINRDGIDSEITFSKHLGDKLPTLQTIRTPEKQSSISSSLASSRRPLTHEACHGYFISFVEQKFPNLTKTDEEYRYGSDAMPDWLDEAAATLCEPPNFQTAREEFLLQNLEARYSLGKLFTMTHPLEALTAANLESNTGTKILRLEAGENVMVKLSMFYSQVQSIANFIVAKTHPNIMEEITSHYANNRGGITTFLKDHTDLPNTLDTLEREWLVWVKK